MRWGPFLSGMAVWIAALAVLVSFPDLPSELEAAVETSAPVGDTGVPEQTEILEELVEPIVPTVAGLEPGISEALAGTGYTQVARPMIPASLKGMGLILILIEHDAVLVVREEVPDE